MVISSGKHPCKNWGTYACSPLPEALISKQRHRKAPRKQSMGGGGGEGGGGKPVHIQWFAPPPHALSPQIHYHPPDASAPKEIKPLSRELVATGFYNNNNNSNSSNNNNNNNNNISRTFSGHLPCRDKIPKCGNACGPFCYRGGGGVELF